MRHCPKRWLLTHGEWWRPELSTSAATGAEQCKYTEAITIRIIVVLLSHAAQGLVVVLFILVIRFESFAIIGMPVSQRSTVMLTLVTSAIPSTVARIACPRHPILVVLVNIVLLLFPR